MVPVVLITFILFLAYYAYRRKQIDKVNTQKESDFWQRENDAKQYTQTGYHKFRLHPNSC